MYSYKIDDLTTAWLCKRWGYFVFRYKIIILFGKATSIGVVYNNFKLWARLN